jgi:hypothetical protein
MAGGVLLGLAVHAGIPIFIGYVEGNQNGKYGNGGIKHTEESSKLGVHIGGAVSLITGVVIGDPSYAALDAIAAVVGWVIGLGLASKS